MAEKKRVLEAAHVALDADSRVDVEAGVIRGVKFLGRESRNKRRYPPEVVKRCVSRYEGAQVYADHDYEQLKHGRPRPLAQWGAVLREVTEKDGQGYGNLHCLKNTPAGALILEAAQRCPDKFGLSPMHYL